MRWLLLLGLLLAAPVRSGVLVQVSPTPSLSMHGRAVEVRIDEHLHVGIGYDLELFKTHYGAMLGSDYFTLRMWGTPFDAPPKPRFWIVAYECEHTRFYNGREVIISRVHILGGGKTELPLDLVTFEFQLGQRVLFNYTTPQGQARVVATRSEGTLYLGRCIGPIMLRIGANQSFRRWQIAVSL